MYFYKVFVLFCVGFSAAAPGPGSTTCSDCEIVSCDVAVIGGGSTGTYTAVRLRDQNFSVAIIEPKTHLGGHAETYTTNNGQTIDYGVIVFAQTDTVRNYFSRFNVSLVVFEEYSTRKPQYVDFSTGRIVDGYTPSSNEEIAGGMTNYALQLARYPGLRSGYGINITYPISLDSDLLIPFGQFVAKHNISGALSTIFIINQGYTPILNISTMYMLKYLNSGCLHGLANGFLTTENHNVQALYENIVTSLRPSNVFLGSKITAIDRTSSQIRILISTPIGRKLVVAKKVIITAAPTIQNLENISLSETETALFSQFFANGYYTGILVNTSLPANFSATAAGTDPSNHNIPDFPGLYSVRANHLAPDHIQVYYGSPTILPASEVQSSIVSAIQRLQKSQGLPETTPQWAAFSAHTPFNLMVSPTAIQDRFYEKLDALQGEYGTFWAGAAFETQDSSSLWVWVDEVLVPKVTAALRADL